MEVYFVDESCSIALIAVPILSTLPPSFQSSLKMVRRLLPLLLSSEKIAVFLLCFIRLIRGPAFRQACIICNSFFSQLCEQPLLLAKIFSQSAVKDAIAQVLPSLLSTPSAFQSDSSSSLPASELASTIHRCVMAFSHSQSPHTSASDSKEISPPSDAVEDAIRPIWLTLDDSLPGLFVQPGKESLAVGLPSLAEAQASMNLNEHMRVESCSHGLRSFKPARNLLIDNARNAFSSDESAGSTKIDVVFRCKYPLVLNSFYLRRLSAYLNRAAAASGYLLVSDAPPTTEQLKLFAPAISLESHIPLWYESHPEAKSLGELRPVA